MQQPESNIPPTTPLRARAIPTVPRGRPYADAQRELKTGIAAPTDWSLHNRRMGDEPSPAAGERRGGVIAIAAATAAAVMAIGYFALPTGAPAPTQAQTLTPPATSAVVDAEQSRPVVANPQPAAALLPALQQAGLIAQNAAAEATDHTDGPAQQHTSPTVWNTSPNPTGNDRDPDEVPSQEAAFDLDGYLKLFNDVLDGRMWWSSDADAAPAAQADTEVPQPPVEPAVIDILPRMMGDSEPEADAPRHPVAATQLVPDSDLIDGHLRVLVNDSRVIRTTAPYYRVSVSQPDVADINPLGPDTLLIGARSSGTTQLVLWDADDNAQTLLVYVANDLRDVQEKLEELLPGERIEAIDLRGRIALRGRVRDIEAAARAEEVASSYGDVVNFLEIAGNQQVMLEIRFAEVSRSAAKQLGVNFAFADGRSVGGSTLGGNFGNINPGTGETGLAGNPSGSYNVPGDTLSTAVTVFGGGEMGQTAFNFFISALRENNLLRVLAEPNLVVLSGEEGEFLAGGEIPIPVPQDRNVTIEYREFGIRLRYLPVVMGDGRIRLRISPEVSELDPSTAVAVAGIAVPGIRKRSLSTTVELMDGQTFAVAGLLDSSVVASKTATPVLGDVPVLGALFRSTRYQRRETELVVLVTPRLVSPMNPDEVPPLPGDGWKHPNEWELFLLGQMGGEDGVSRPSGTDPRRRAGATRVGDEVRAEETATPRFEGSYSFAPAN